MSDPTPPVQPPSPTQTPEPVVATVPAKRPGPLRPAGIILLVLLVLGAWLSVPWLIEPWLVREIKTGIAALGLDVSPDTRWEVKLFAGKVRAENLLISETYKGETHTVMTADTTEIDLDFASIFSGDVILDSLIATGVSGDFRRRGDGSVPLITPPEEPGKESEWSKIDWFDYAQKAYTWWEERDRAAKEAEKNPDAKPKVPPVAKKDPNWEGAQYYEPVQPPGYGPRVLIHNLNISGNGVKLPDDTPFEITGFTLTGSDVCLIQGSDELMTLKAEITTAGTGPLQLNLERNPGEDGSLALDLKQVPVAALADPKISGDSLAPYQPTGISDLTVDATWSASALVGKMVTTISGLDFVPPAGDRQAEQLHAIVKRLDGKPLAWPVRIGGTLGSPRITDTGVDDLIKGSIADAAKDEARDRAAEEAAKVLDKNPELKKASEKAGNPLKNLLGK